MQEERPDPLRRLQIQAEEQLRLWPYFRSHDTDTYGARSSHHIFASRTSTFSIIGGCVSSSEDFAISAAATRPERWA